MKLFILAIFLGLQLSGSAYGQDHRSVDSPLTVALNGGLTLSNMSSKGFNIQEQLFGNLRQSFQSGGTLEFKITPNLKVRSGVQYASLGGKSEEQIQTDTEGRELGMIRVVEQLNYVEVPLQLKYVIPQRSYQPYLASGLTIGFLSSAQRDLDSNVDGISSVVDADITDIRKETALGIDFSAGVQVPLHASIGIDIGGIYNLGLSNQLKNADEDLSLKLRSWRFILGLYMAI